MAPVFLSEEDDGFEDARQGAYRDFVVESAAALPESLHEGYRRAFRQLRKDGLFRHDVVQAGGKVLSKTFVRRTLVGEPGITYKYLGLRIFAHPWRGDGSAAPTKACALVGQLNEALKARTKALLEEDSSRRSGSCDFNLTLINEMEAMENDPALRQSPLGKVSVSWHADSGLQAGSSIAVYHQTDAPPGERDWRIALKASDDASSVPGIVASTESGDLYHLLHTFNDNFQHAVLSGHSKRYSSTHRVAKLGSNTFSELEHRCSVAISEASGKAMGKKRKRKNGEARLRSQLRLQDEVEFEWLRQWYIQGQYHAAIHSWWHQPIEFLTSSWKKLDQITRLKASALVSEAAGGASSRARTLVASELQLFISLLTERLKKREYWVEREGQRIWKSLPEDMKPVPFPEASADVEDCREMLRALQVAHRDLRRTTTKPGTSSDADPQRPDPSSAPKAKARSNWTEMQGKMKRKKMMKLTTGMETGRGTKDAKGTALADDGDGGIDVPPKQQDRGDRKRQQRGRQKTKQPMKMRKRKK